MSDRFEPTADLSRTPDHVWVQLQRRLNDSAAASGTTETIAVDLGDTLTQLVIVTVRGARTGALRQVPLIRVEHEGTYAVVASKAGAATNPAWYHNIAAHPEVEIWDGPTRRNFTAREVHGDERELWWDRAVRVWPYFLDYQAKTRRLIPVLVLTSSGPTTD
jgi:F420H(2)-dependent quinone reductase